MSRRHHFAALRDASPAVLPSLLMCDYAHLQDEVDRLEAAGVAALHLDVMDGRFVPNLSYGLPLVEAFRKMTRLPLDVHLMISTPGEYVERFFDAGADGMTIHAEAVDDPRPVLEKIRSLGASAGLAINPPTPVSAIRNCLDACDLVLVMSVMPGFGGQEFDRRALGKLKELRPLVGDDVLLEIDGGVHETTIADCTAAGAQLLVVGSAIFKSNDYAAAIGELNDLAAAH
ncbi:MAG TPA: ribulose-phosphate 3-epimerase [Pirellulales bacterium]|nr:ribulose-phosphate 3-epimerase [Pirellulales bacterium]